MQADCSWAKPQPFPCRSTHSRAAGLQSCRAAAAGVPFTQSQKETWKGMSLGSSTSSSAPFNVIADPDNHPVGCGAQSEVTEQCPRARFFQTVPLRELISCWMALEGSMSSFMG